MTWSHYESMTSRSLISILNTPKKMSLERISFYTTLATTSVGLPQLSLGILNAIMAIKCTTPRHPRDTFKNITASSTRAKAFALNKALLSFPTYYFLLLITLQLDTEIEHSMDSALRY